MQGDRLNRDVRKSSGYRSGSVKGADWGGIRQWAMKTVTKARRRANLGFAGLGMLDETEVETSPESLCDSKPASLQTRTSQTARSRWPETIVRRNPTLAKLEADEAARLQLRFSMLSRPGAGGAQ